MRANFTAFLIGILTICIPSCWNGEIGETINGHDIPIELGGYGMATHPVTAADYGGVLPLVSIQVPDDGTDIEAAHIQAPVTALLAEVDDIRNNAVTGLANKVNRTGDTMTGSLTITPAAGNGLIVSGAIGSGQNAIQAMGDGIGPAIIGTGGNNGAGASFTAGGGNNFGARGIGNGNEVGIEGTGGVTGAGVRGRAGTASTATAPTIAAEVVDGGITLTGVVSPNATQNPGFDFAQFPQSMVSSSAIVTSDVFTVNAAGFNVASFTGDAVGNATVTFARNLPGVNYRPHVFTEDGYDARWNGVQNVNNWGFVVRDMTTNATVDLTATTIVFFVTTVGY